VSDHALPQTVQLSGHRHDGAAAAFVLLEAFMQDTSPGDKAPKLLAEWSTERLDSWKEIAAFFRREVRTVQLWEKSEGLPIRRLQHRKLGSVYAYRRELESWWAARSAQQTGLVPQVSSTASAGEGESSTDTPKSSMERILLFPFDCQQDCGRTKRILQGFTDCLQDELLQELRRIQCEPVRLTTRNFPAPGSYTATFLRSTAREFGAEFYLTGNARSAGNQVRVYLQLMRSQDASCVWSDRFDTILDQGFQAHSELAQKIVGRLPEHMVPSAILKDYQHSEEPGPAYHACRMGLHFWKQRTRTDLLKAAAYYQEALLLDPECSDAYAGLADTYVSLSYNHQMPARQAMEAAKRAVEAGSTLAPGSLNVRNAEINFRANCAWEWTAAERLCQKIVDSGCVDARTFQLYASLMINLGRHDEAIRLSLHAHRLDPFSDSVNSQVSFSYFYAGDYDSALYFIDRTIELRPRFTIGHVLLGRTQAERGNWQEAIHAFERGLGLSARSLLLKALVAYGYAGLGDSDKANGILREIEADAGDECFPAYDVSAVHAKLHQDKEALENILKAYAMHDMKLTYLRHDPRFNGLRSLPELRTITASIFPGSFEPS
jgi:TolB-like protein/tetratricopeptide (TPR) repeat protein